MSNINPIFTYVSDSDIDSFLSNYVDYEVEVFNESDKYKDKIVFLGSSGKFTTQGKIYGQGSEVFLGDETDAPKDAKIIINTDDTDDTAITYSKSEINYLLSIKANNKIIERPVVTTISITPDKYYIWDTVTELNISLTEPTNTELVAEYQFQFTSGNIATTLSLPTGLKWASDKTISPNTIYQVSILNNVIVLCGA